MNSESQQTPEETAKEAKEKAETKELAESFDLLVSCPGWQNLLVRAAEKVTGTLHTAATTETAQEKLLKVERWDAQREFLDWMQDVVDNTRAERDELLKEEKLDARDSN